MHDIDLIIFDGFPLMSLSMVTEPLRIANRESLQDVFSWRIVSETGASVFSSSNFPLPTDASFDEAPARDAVIVLTSYRAEQTTTAGAIKHVKQIAAGEALLGCVETGAYLFAAAGILKDHPAAVHHESVAGYRTRFPEGLFIDKLFDMSRNRCSSSGGVATLDMTLALISHFEGQRLANRVAEVLNYLPLASERAQGSFGPDWSLDRIDKRLAGAIKIMADNIEQPVTIPQIAERINLPLWKLQRLFKKYFHESPTRHYLGRRLDRARSLLRNSPASVGDISVQCGFNNFETFSRSYKKRFGKPPSSDRQY
jgi:transcriptional regulator GlxA family with amidase domain